MINVPALPITKAVVTNPLFIDIAATAVVVGGVIGVTRWLAGKAFGKS